jgi:hypothetical protein
VLLQPFSSIINENKNYHQLYLQRNNQSLMDNLLVNVPILSGPKPKINLTAENGKKIFVL